MVTGDNDLVAIQEGDTTLQVFRAPGWTRSTLVTGFFKNRTAAEAAFDVLLKRGYPREEISLLMSDETRTKTFGLASGTHAAEGATAGGVLGGTVGGVLAAVAAVGTNLALPGLGLVIAGPIAAALAGIGAGTVTGGLVPGAQCRVKRRGRSGIRTGHLGRRSCDQDATGSILGRLFRILRRSGWVFVGSGLEPVFGFDLIFRRLESLRH